MKPAKPINARDFSSAIEKLSAALGKEWVYTESSDLHLYRDAYSPLWDEDNELLPSAAVAPENVEQVQAIVRIANDYKLPLFPISTGKNLGYGGSAPSHSGCVIVDLLRMNKIIEVDDRRHFAIVEPGVTYFDLYHYIQENNLRVWIDTAEPGWGSVMGNALDHGIGWTTLAYRDHFRCHSGMEVVLPDGELMRTGAGALPGSGTWGQFHYGFGPDVDGLFAQGNYGIVTKMGFWLMPEPDAYQTCLVSVPRRNDLIPLVDVITEIEHAQLVGLPKYDSKLAHLDDPELNVLIDRPGGPVVEELDAYASNRDIPAWECILPFYGPEETIRANINYTRRRLRERIPDVQFTEDRLFRFPMSDEEKKQVPFRVAIGAPNMDAFAIGARSKFNPAPYDGHLLFSPVIPKTGEAALHAISVLAELYKGTGQAGNSWFAPPQAWMPRSFLLVTGFPVSRSDKAVNERSRSNYLRALRTCAANGWGEYRATPVFHDQVAGVYSFNNHALRRFRERIKDAVDPNGIIAPGRGGVWPRHIRDREV